MNLAELLWRRARAAPSAPAIGIGRRLVSDYAGFAVRAGALARSLLRRHALRPGDRVVVYMGNCAEYAETLFGCWAAGLVAVPVNSRLHARELAFILEDTAASFLITDRDHATGAGEAAQTLSGLRVVETCSEEFRLLQAGERMDPVALDPEALAWIFYTSGTTGRPKGAMLSHRNLLCMSLAYQADIDALSCADSFMHAAPM